jgi:hypothetical protein
VRRLQDEATWRAAGAGGAPRRSPPLFGERKTLQPKGPRVVPSHMIHGLCPSHDPAHDWARFDDWPFNEMT